MRYRGRLSSPPAWHIWRTRARQPELLRNQTTVPLGSIGFAQVWPIEIRSDEIAEEMPLFLDAKRFSPAYFVSLRSQRQADAIRRWPGDLLMKGQWFGFLEGQHKRLRFQPSSAPRGRASRRSARIQLCGDHQRSARAQLSRVSALLGSRPFSLSSPGSRPAERSSGAARLLDPLGQRRTQYPRSIQTRRRSVPSCRLRFLA